MPIYEYSCPACGKSFEEFVRASDDTEKAPCPHCGAEAPRMLSNTSFILKGGGWFASSYGHGTSNLFDKTNGVPSVSDSKPAAEGSSTPKADAAPAAPAAASSDSGTKA